MVETDSVRLLKCLDRGRELKGIRSDLDGTGRAQPSRTVLPGDSARLAGNAPGKQAKGARRWLFVTLGVIFVALGAIGVVLPGIPTTPFLILASYFLVRSSPRLHRRLLASATFGPMLRDWEAHRAISARLKRLAIACCVVMIILSVAFGGLPWIARLLVAIAGAYGISFVWRLPTLPAADSGSGDDEEAEKIRPPRSHSFHRRR